MRVLITGETGQLGFALKNNQPKYLAEKGIDVMFSSRTGKNGRLKLDLADLNNCIQVVQDIKPDWIINTAAYTAVDRAETEKNLAYTINTEAPHAISQVLKKTGGRMLHISTDFVFNGCQSEPYRPSSSRAPLGIYGSSKAAGEEAILQNLGAERSTLLRTSWVYGSYGNNFMLTMLRLHRERQEISVVDDQIGCPTTANSLAKCCWSLVNREISGIYHWANAGVASWYDFAAAIGDLAKQYNLLSAPAAVIPIHTDQYPTLAKRPKYSVLDCQDTRRILNLRAIHWRSELESVIKSMSTL